jgi:Zn-dependent protease
MFFTSLLVHELSHSLVAKAHGIPVKEITLFALGGVSQIERESATARIEFWMAFAGPLASAAIGAVCLGFARLPVSAPITVMFAWLGYINLALAGFNMIPGYPLDGGRILRAIVWWRTGDLDYATHAAARAGQAVAVLFIMAGLGDYLAGGGFNGLWITFIGWFLLQAASESRAQVGLKRSLESVRVADVMSHEVPVVDGHLNLQHFVEDELLRTGRRCFVVMDNGALAGMVTPHEIKHAERRKWPFTTLHDVMLPAGDIRTVAPEESLESALELMGTQDLNQLPVIANGKLQGILSRGDIVSYLQTRAEMQT